jgi:hypothetical protein
MCTQQQGFNPGFDGARRISGALGWAATLDILLLFYPVPRSVFLHWLMGTNFPTLIKYHR